MGAVLLEAIGILAAGPGDDPRAEAEWVVADVLGMRRADLALRLRDCCLPSRRRRVLTLARRRRRGVPLQVALGRWDFHGMTFQVRAGVLIPRPETEELVDRVLAAFLDDPPRRVVDVGTGTGVIAITLRTRRPSWSVTAIDRSRAALALTRENARRLDAPIDVIEGDVRSLDRPPVPFDILVSNPPYIPSGDLPGLDPQVLDYDPLEALDGGPDGLDLIRSVLDYARRAVVAAGTVFLEIGADQASVVRRELLARGFEEPRVHRDLAGRDRVVESRLGAGEGNDA